MLVILSSYPPHIDESIKKTMPENAEIRKPIVPGSHLLNCLLLSCHAHSQYNIWLWLGQKLCLDVIACLPGGSMPGWLQGVGTKMKSVGYKPTLFNLGREGG